MVSLFSSPFSFHFILLSSMIILCYPLPGEFQQLSKRFQLGSNLHLQSYFLILHYTNIPFWPSLPAPTLAYPIPSHVHVHQLFPSLITWSSLIFQSPISSKKPAHQNYSSLNLLLRWCHLKYITCFLILSCFHKQMGNALRAEAMPLILGILSNMQ